ncbi:HEAT repeat domain-containing protein [Actinomadura sp. CNU-125]|uniref:HEAT repeat domain-containing protein n=1 Tax=Actinomadura sp. CNU-125 TaxID=1904961 RepID=UPI001178A04B|nr:HEAT repeat domain-containing protein [Actinomadura sp. CNU-125]
MAEFEERHEVELPPDYRLFITELGAEGAGPGYRLCRLDTACCTYRRSGHLAQPSPYLPGPRYFGDWEQRYEDVPRPDRNFLRGTLAIAAHGCSLVTHLVVTGPARGRLFNLDSEGPVGPYVVEDIDFLAWYERWLDEIVAGYDVGWFGERLPLDEPELLAVLTDDPSPPRRARAGESLLQQPALGDTAWNALLAAMTSDPDPTVRANCGTNCVGKGTSTGALCPTPKRSRTTSRNTPGRALHAGSTH